MTYKKLLISLLLIPALAFGADSTEQFSFDWVPSEFNAEDFNAVISEIPVNGFQVLQLEFTPYRSQGVLEGCGYSYFVLLRDWAYRSDQVSAVNGSVVFWDYQDRVPFLAHRIQLTDIEERNGELWQKYSMPNYSYLRHETQSTVREESNIIDFDSGFRTFVYLDPEYEKMEWFLVGDGVTIAFNRIDAGFDIEFSIPVISSEIW